MLYRGVGRRSEAKNEFEIDVRTSIWRDVRTLAIEEAYTTKYSIHPGADTMLCGFRLTNRWLSMKKDIASCGSKYLAYLEVEVEYQGSSGLLLQPELPEWGLSFEYGYASFEAWYGKECRLWVVEDLTLERCSTFGKKDKLEPSYVGPFEIFVYIGPTVRVKKFLSYELRYRKIGWRTVKVMDQEVMSKSVSMIALVKVRWDSKRGPELTWERKDRMRSKCPQLFVDSANASSVLCKRSFVKLFVKLFVGIFWKAKQMRDHLRVSMACLVEGHQGPVLPFKLCTVLFLKCNQRNYPDDSRLLGALLDYQVASDVVYIGKKSFSLWFCMLPMAYQLELDSAGGDLLNLCHVNCMCFQFFSSISSSVSS
ncbi:hypothetical protein Tco_1274355 [Tanacetum coccineum]